MSWSESNTNSPIKMTQDKEWASLDALIVLGGEGKDHSRTNKTLEVIERVSKLRKDGLAVILTGHHHILDKNILPKQTTSQCMKNYLLSKGVQKENVFLEEDSQDTLENFVYSWHILNYLPSANFSKKIGIVTDSFHMDRSIWTANRVYGNEFSTVAIPTGKETGWFGKITEKAVKWAWTIDLDIERLQPGDYYRFIKYVETEHPGPIYRKGIFFLDMLHG